MNVLAFYAEYTGRNLKLKYLRVMPLCVLGMALYLGSYIYLRDADEKLYVGKQSGKNMLVSAKTSI